MVKLEVVKVEELDVFGSLVLSNPVTYIVIQNWKSVLEYCRICKEEKWVWIASALQQVYPTLFLIKTDASVLCVPRNQHVTPVGYWLEKQ